MVQVLSGNLQLNCSCAELIISLRSQPPRLSRHGIRDEERRQGQVTVGLGKTDNPHPHRELGSMSVPAMLTIPRSTMDCLQKMFSLDHAFPSAGVFQLLPGG